MVVRRAWFNRLADGIELADEGSPESEKGRKRRSGRCVREEESRYTWKSVEGRQ